MPADLIIGCFMIGVVVLEVHPECWIVGCLEFVLYPRDWLKHGLSGGSVEWLTPCVTRNSYALGVWTFWRLKWSYLQKATSISYHHTLSLDNQTCAVL